MFGGGLVKKQEKDKQERWKWFRGFSHRGDFPPVYVFQVSLFGLRFDQNK